MSVNSVRHVRVSGATERRPALNVGGVGVERARIQRCVRQRAALKDGPCANGYIRIMGDVTNSVRCKAPARIATHAPPFSGTVAQCSGVR